MSYSFPRLAFDRSKYVSLDQAFQTLGAYLFPDEWSGREIASWPVSSCDSLSKELAYLLGRSEESARELGELKLDFYRERDQETRSELKTLLRAAEEEADVQRASLEDFRQSHDSRMRDAIAYERKQTVIRNICNAVRNEELVLRLHGGTGYGEMRDWIDHPRFRISFEYSYVVPPVRLGRRQKSKAYFEKDQFDTWTAPLLPQLSAFRIASVEDDLVFWFKQFVASESKTGGRFSRVAVLERCQNEFKRADEIAKLGKAVEAVWELFAPDNWKKGGKPTNPPRV